MRANAPRNGAGRSVILLGIVVGGMGTAVFAQAPQPPATPGLTQENVLREAIAEFPGTDAITFNGVFAPGATSGRHRHPGTEVIHVIQGSALVLQQGREPVELSAGMTIVAQPDAKGGSFVHELRNLSDTDTMRTYIVLLVEKGAPPAIPLE